MKKIKLQNVFLSLLLGIGSVAAASYPALKSIQAERHQDLQDMIQLDNRFHDALENKDFPALQKMLSDNFELYTVNGEVLSKQELILNIQKGGLNYENIIETSARMKGNQLVRTNIVSGTFWGREGSWKIEATITALDRSDHSNCQIKKAVLKVL